MEITPDNMKNLIKIASNFFTTTIFSPFIPNIVEENGSMKKLDIKCGFSKQFLDGKIDEINVSQIWFKELNKVEWNLNVGCGVFVNDKSSSMNPMELLKAFDEENTDYKVWRSIFVKVHGSAELEFNNDVFLDGLVFGKVKEFDF
jgi:hypothetical protein